MMHLYIYKYVARIFKRDSDPLNPHHNPSSRKITQEHILDVLPHLDGINTSDLNTFKNCHRR